MNKTRLLTLFAVAGAIAATTGCVGSRIAASQKLAEQAEPFSARPEQHERRILVVGDSTGVGTGAARPEDSVAGRISSDHPTWLIDNRAANGAKFEDVVGQLEVVQKRYDLVLVLAGGNDVIRLTSADKLRRDISRAVQLAQGHAPVVVLMPSGNVGHAPFFFPPVSWLMSDRSKALHVTMQQVASESGARYVRLLEPPETDPFALEPKTMNAEDGLHPSSKGYAQWYSELVKQGGLVFAPAQ